MQSRIVVYPRGPGSRSCSPPSISTLRPVRCALPGGWTPWRAASVAGTRWCNDCSTLQRRSAASQGCGPARGIAECHVCGAGAGARRRRSGASHASSRGGAAALIEERLGESSTGFIAMSADLVGRRELCEVITVPIVERDGLLVDDFLKAICPQDERFVAVIGPNPSWRAKPQEMAS